MFRSAIIAGLGALGSELAQHVGHLKPRQVILVDQDLLEYKNIERSIFWRDASPGQSKVVAAAQILSNAFPDTEWIGITGEIADLSTDFFVESDILLGAVDTDLARVEMAAIGARYALDICDAGLGGTSLHVGRVSWFPHDRDLQSACFTCLLSARRRAELLQFWQAENHSCSRSTQPLDPTWSSTSETVKRIAKVQAMAAARAGTRRSRWPSQTLQIDLGAKQRVHRIHHLHSEDCPFHDNDVFRGELFPRCSRAVCSSCGTTVPTSVRVGWLRNWGRCDQCGGRQVPDDARQFVTEADEQFA
ncbi:ThiF family adenylyltransferase [Silvibacterium acidisoli]|uniref:ThiF family adenylyltransferase n=1 Tax=Acidobacteriaceae bacterium ZG23-2 TaxID=2883246 RepID=UPI00406D25C7